MSEVTSIVDIHPDAPWTPVLGLGGRCCATGPLDDHLDFERLWTGTIEFLKSQGPKNHAGPGVLKEGKLEITSDTEFVITKVVEDKETTTIVREAYSFDNKAKGNIIIHSLLLPFGPLIGLTFLSIFQSPLRIEWAWQSINYQKRRAGPVVAARLADLLKEMLQHEVAVQQNFKSAATPGWLNAASEPLDSHMTIDKLWDILVHSYKTQSCNNLLKGDVTVQEVRDNEHSFHFRVYFSVDGPAARKANKLPEGPGDIPLMTNVLGEKAKHVLSVYNHYFITEQIMPLLELQQFVVANDPLRIETWIYDPLPVMGPQELRPLVAQCLDAIIKGPKEDE